MIKGKRVGAMSIYYDAIYGIEPSIDSLPLLIENLKCEDETELMWTISAIGQYRKRAISALPHIKRFINSPDRVIRSSAKLTYIEIQGQKAIPEIESLLKDKDQHIRNEIIRLLKRENLCSKEIVKILIRYISDRAYWVRQTAIYNLIDFRRDYPEYFKGLENEYQNNLLKRLNDKFFYVRRAVALSLAIFATKEAKFSIMKRVFYEEDTSTKFYLALALIKIDGLDSVGAEIINELKEKKLLSKEKITLTEKILQNLDFSKIANLIKSEFASDKIKMLERILEKPTLTEQEKKLFSEIFNKERVFLAFAEEDVKVVEEFYFKLKEINLNPWMYTKDGIAGENWKENLPETIRKSKFAIICLSTHSITKRGFFQREIKCILEEYEMKPQGTIYAIPLRINKCEVPNILVGITRLTDLTWIDYFSEKGFSKIINSMIHELRK